MIVSEHSIIYIALNAFDLFIILRYYKKIFGDCQQKKTVLVLCSIFFLIFFSCFIKAELPYTNLVNISFWSSLFIIFYNDSVKIKVLMIFIQIALAGISQSVPYVLTKMHGVDLGLKAVITGHLLFGCLLELGSRLYKVHTRRIKGRMWFLLLLIPIASFFSMPCVLLLGLKSSLPLCTLYECLVPICLFFIFINFSAFYLFDKLSLFMEASEQNIRLEEQLQYQTSFYRLMEEEQTNIRGMKHDMKNDLETVHGLLEQDKVSDAKAFIERLTQTIGVYENVITTKNAPIDIILNIKLNAAAKCKIVFSYQINIPAGLPVSYEQATAVLGNLLDNAIEAQKRLEEDKRKIDLRMTYSANTLLISIKNPFNGEKVDMKTTKKDDGQHGIGLLNVKRMVDSMNGMLSLSTKGNVFQADVLFNFENNSYKE